VTKDGVKVGDKVYTSTYTIIGTGSKPRTGFGYDKTKIITSNEALNLEEIPKDITIYGSGAIGLEMACLFRSLGSEVSLMYRHSKLTKFHSKINENLESLLKEIGIKLIPNNEIQDTSIQKNKVIITTQQNQYKASYLLLAIGREANIAVVQTDEIEVDKYIKVDDYFRTTKNNVFAIGDVNGKSLLAHSARAQALNVVEQILGNKEKLDLDLVPKFIYTLPLSYSSIGVKTDKEAVFKVSNLGISKSFYLDELGMIVVYVDDENFIKGVEILAPNAEELIGIFATALAGEMDVNTLKKAIFPHPTYSEMVDRVIRRIR
jgi:dihydrolipoamide dehydrogenase